MQISKLLARVVHLLKKKTFVAMYRCVPASIESFFANKKRKIPISISPREF